MKLMSIEYDLFPEVKTLNHNFSEESKKLRFVLDVSLENPLLGKPKALNLEDFYPYFKTLTSHSCGHCTRADDRGEDFAHHASDSILSVDENVDIAHYMEHMILDLQYHLGGLEQVSGVTVQRTGKPDEFITYVECEEPRLGMFCINFILAMLHQALYCGTIDHRYHAVLKLAHWLRVSGTSHEALANARESLAMNGPLWQFCVNSLNAFQFSEERIPSSELSASDMGPILIIEDNDELQDIIATTLNAKGYETICVSDGKSGIARLCEYVAGIVLLDIYLPDIDGIAIAKWILETQPSTTIILTSGDIVIPDGVQVSTNAIRFLPKPFDIVHLEQLLIDAHCYN